jgi:NADPH:quinone reductase-like Zn-dependent oxidoreductase
MASENVHSARTQAATNLPRPLDMMQHKVLFQGGVDDMTTTGRLAGKTALISAAGQGIGRSTAELFAKEGANVIATDVNEDALAELAQIDGITAVKLDVTDGDAVKKVAPELWRMARSSNVPTRTGISALI